MIDKNYNQKFRNFFSKFEKEFFTSESKEEKDFLWNLAVDFVERNRDFVMQYPLIHSWQDINASKYGEVKKELLSSYNGKNINLYFHIPFCKTKCSYCNFHIIVWDGNKNIMQRIYIEKLKYEVLEFLEYNSNFSIDTIFIGGGTPSYLDDEVLEDFLSYINTHLWKYMSKSCEFSFEGNPDSITPSKIKILKKNNVNRVSIGVQTFDEQIIKNINRTYTKETVFEVLKNLKQEGFENINIDMIYWLPGWNYENMRKDLDTVKALDISHITYYPLYYYENSILSRTWKAENNIQQIYNFYDEVVEQITHTWLNQYGREYFCKNNQIHNYQNNYVSNKLLYGFGHSAYSFNWDVAFYKEQDLRKYIQNKENIDKIFYYDDNTHDRRLFVLWSRNRIIEKSNIRNIPEIKNSIKLLLDMKLLQEETNSYVLTDFWLKYQEIVAHMIV